MAKYNSLLALRNPFWNWIAKNSVELDAEMSGVFHYNAICLLLGGGFCKGFRTNAGECLQNVYQFFSVARSFVFGSQNYLRNSVFWGQRFAEKLTSHRNQSAFYLFFVATFITNLIHTSARNSGNSVQSSRNFALALSMHRRVFAIKIRATPKYQTHLSLKAKCENRSSYL